MKTALVRRRGFTLIELLVVISIIVVLATLSAGTYFRINAAEKVRATNATLSKINTSIDRKWAAVNDAAKKDYANGTIPPGIVSFAGNDRDRARVIWTYLKQKNEFPTTFAEARTPITLPGGYVLQPLKVFTQQLPASAGSPELESAACLYLALTATATGGEVTDVDGLGQQTATINVGTGTVRVFVDAWDNPITFVRLAMSDEVNTSPYLRPRQGLADTARDPNDPPLGNPPTMGTLARATATWTTTGAGNSLDSFWSVVVQNHINYPGAGALVPVTYPTTGSALSRNWVPTAVSAGPNKLLDNNLFDADSDNLVSYRLRREGNRGD